MCLIGIWNFAFEDLLMNIGLDMMGGDFAPLEVIKGVSHYLSEKSSSAHLTLIGDETQVKALLTGIKSSHYKYCSDSCRAGDRYA